MKYHHKHIYTTHLFSNFTMFIQTKTKNLNSTLQETKVPFCIKSKCKSHHTRNEYFLSVMQHILNDKKIAYCGSFEHITEIINKIATRIILKYYDNATSTIVRTLTFQLWQAAQHSAAQNTHKPYTLQHSYISTKHTSTIEILSNTSHDGS